MCYNCNIWIYILFWFSNWMGRLFNKYWWCISISIIKYICHNWNICTVLYIQYITFVAACCSMMMYASLCVCDCDVRGVHWVQRRLVRKCDIMWFMLHHVTVMWLSCDICGIVTMTIATHVYTFVWDESSTKCGLICDYIIMINWMFKIKFMNHSRTPNRPNQARLSMIYFRTGLPSPVLRLE